MNTLFHFSIQTFENIWVPPASAAADTKSKALPPLTKPLVLMLSPLDEMDVW